MSSGQEQISEALAALARIQMELHGIATRSDEQRKYDLVELRRRLASQIAQIGQMSEPLFQGAEPAVAQEYRNRFAAMRSASAMHQANWPAVRLGEDTPAYQRSGETAGDAMRAFISWMRATVPHLGARHSG